MGVVVLMDTRIYSEDESGLEYFIKSLEFNSLNVGALFNVIEEYGLSVNNHTNIKALDEAIYRF